MFTFSAPKSCQTPAIQSSLPYLRPAASKSTEVTKVPPPLLANGSVLDALKKPEFKPFGKGPSVSGTKKESIIDLTDDENRGGDEVSVVSSRSCFCYFICILYFTAYLVHSSCLLLNVLV